MFHKNPDIKKYEKARNDENRTSMRRCRERLNMFKKKLEVSVKADENIKDCVYVCAGSVVLVGAGKLVGTIVKAIGGAYKKVPEVVVNTVDTDVSPAKDITKIKAPKKTNK